MVYGDKGRGFGYVSAKAIASPDGVTVLYGMRFVSGRTSSWIK